MPENRRDHYRIPYPADQRPRLVVGLSILEVLDCSEGGLRFVPPADAEDEGAGEVEGRLRLPGGEELRVRGEVVRSAEGERALRFEGRGIPFRTILRQQVYLRGRLRGSAS